MAKFLSGRTPQLNVGVSSSTESATVLQVTGKVGIGTTNAGSRNLYVIGDVETTGVTTLASSGGITTTGGDLYVGGDLFIKDDLFFDEFTARNANISGIATINNLIATATSISQLQVSGISTFTNGTVFISTTTSTGTLNQALQVNSGVYVSDKVGIGTTNPTSKLHVIGNGYYTGVITAIAFNGDINSGIGTIITLTSTNSTITNISNTNISSGVGTITTLVSSSSSLTNLYSSGISTLTTVGINSNLFVSGITTLGVVTSTNITGQNLVVSGVTTLGVTSTTSLIAQKLTVSGASTIFTNTSDTSLRIVQEGTGNILVVEDSSSSDLTPFIINNDGNVGIGTTNPTSKLYVSGDTYVTGIVTATTFVGALTGIAASATKLVTARTFEITGDIVASPISFDGTGNVSLAATIQPNSVALGNDTTGDYVQTISGTSNQITISSGTGEGSTPVVAITTNPTLPGNVTVENNLIVDTNTLVVNSITDRVGVGTTNPTSKLYVSGDTYVTGVVTATTFFGALTGIAASATQLVTPRNFEITGDVVASAISFDGTGNVSLAATIQPNSVALGTDTTGDYVQSISGTSNQITITSGTGESSTPVVAISTNPTLPGNVTVQNDLIVDTNTLVVNSATDRVGIGTTNPTSKLYVVGDGYYTGIVTATTFVGALTGIAASATKLVTSRTFEITGDVVATAISFDGTSNVSLAATIQPNSVALGTDTTGDYVQSISGTSNQITVTSGTGESSTPTLSIPSQFTAPQDVTVTRDLQVNRNLNVNGNITIGGTSVTLFATELKVADPDLVLGIRTDNNDNDVSTDNTANHGGIAVASTEGNPLVQLYNPGIGESTPATYKKIMWFKAGSFAGLNTDAWLVNYAIGIGSTQVPNGVRLAVGGVQITDTNIKAVTGNYSGIVTATTFVGALTGTATTATKLQNSRTFEITGDVVASVVSFDGTGNVSLAATIQPNSVALGTDTTGDYVQSISGTSNQITITGGSGEGSTPVVAITTNPTLPGNVTVENDLIVDTNTLVVKSSSDKVGIGTTNPTSKLYVSGDTYVTGVVTATTFIGALTGTATTSTNVVGGVGSLSQLQVTGISTFTNGPVLIGSGTSTGTSNQNFQVTGDGYISGNFGVGSTLPNTKLEVDGIIGFTESSNVRIGDYQTGYAISSGYDNVFLGKYAGRNTSTGYENTFVGSKAGSGIVNGSSNIFVGVNAGTYSFSGSGNENVYVGSYTDHLGGSQNVVIGPRRNVPNGNNQLAIGAGNTDWIVGNSSYNIGIGTDNPTEKLQVIGNILVNNTTIQGSVTAIGTTTIAIGIHSGLSTSTYRSIEYTIQATQGSNYHATKILTLHDGTNTYQSEYGTIYNNNIVATYDTDISGGTIRLLASGISTLTTNYVVNFIATKI